MHTDEQLARLATTAGLAIGWVDAFGNPQMVGQDTLLNVLEALGLPCRTREQCRDSLRQLEREHNDVSLPPLITGLVGSSIKLSPMSGLEGQSYRIHFEGGGTESGRFVDGHNALETVAIHQPGYHRLELEQSEITLAVAPPKCFGMHDLGLPPGSKPWAVSVQLYSLRRPEDGGIGTYDALADFASEAGRHGASAVAVSPTHALFSADARRFSPYGPSSRVFLNVFHIDPATVLGEAGLQQAYQQLGADVAERCRRLTELPLIDWQSAIALRLELLRALYRIFMQQPSSLRKSFDDFRQAGGQGLHDHAIYETLHAEFHRHPGGHDWRNWPQAYRDPRNAAVAEYAQRNADEVGFHTFLQWQAELGLGRAQQAARASGMPVGLVSDMAIGADAGGSQSWSRHEQFLQGLSVGAPPDVFFQQGQSWGISALSTHGMRQHGYQAYIEMLRSAFAHAGGVRIDHVLGLVRLWLVPEGGSAKDGVYLHYPTDDLIRLISLESHRHRAIVIGEDLGTLPPGSRHLFSQGGIMGMNVLWFEREGAKFNAPAMWHPTAIATTGTHDMPTTAGWWTGRDIEIQSYSEEQRQQAYNLREHDRACLQQALHAELGQDYMPELGQAVTESQVVDAAIAYTHRAPCPLTIIPVEDMLGLHDQPNLPGTIDEHPNWRRRLPVNADDVFNQPDAQRRAGILNKG